MQHLARTRRTRRCPPVRCHAGGHTATAGGDGGGARPSRARGQSSGWRVTVIGCRGHWHGIMPPGGAISGPSSGQPAPGRDGGGPTCSTSRRGGIPEHTHKGYELTLLLAGTIEDGDTRYQAGGFHLARRQPRPQSPNPGRLPLLHGAGCPVQFTKGGCRGCSTASVSTSLTAARR